MSQGTVKSELSPDGGLKLTIKREKAVKDACEPEWVTEARGKGLGKLVIKRKSPGTVSQPPETSSLHVDRQTEQRPILRLSITSSDGSRHAQVKSWSLCEVPSAAEDAVSVSELSPACQLQPSPKDSGIDISSPPHDDGAVGVEPNAATGIWSAADSHAGDSSAVDVEKLETTDTSYVHNTDGVHSGNKALWLDAALPVGSCESNHKVQSTLRNRGERFALKSVTRSSQKLVNPLAKSHRVGRYQHMLPVNRIRAESNVARRSSLEESPTYNMVTSRTSLFSRLPRVKTKLKLLSNNTYTPVFDHETESSEQCDAAQKSKGLNVNKPSRAVVERKRNRHSCKSPSSETFENMKVKLCFNHKNPRSDQLPKLKFVVKSEPAVSVSCVEDTSVTAAVKQAEENTARHVRRKRRQHEIGKTKASSNIESADSLRATDSSNVDHVLFSKAAAVRSCHSKHTKQVVDWEPSGKKSKLQSSTEELTGKSREMMSDSQQPVEESCSYYTNAVTIQSVDCKVSADEAVDGEVMSLPSVQTDKLADHSSVCDASSNEDMHTAVHEEAGKSENVSAMQTESFAVSAETDSNDTGAIHGDITEIDSEKSCSEGYRSENEKCAVLNTDDDRSTVDWQHDEQLSLPDDSEDVVTEEMQTAMHQDTTSGGRDEETLVDDMSSVMIASSDADSRPCTDQTRKSPQSCAEFDEVSLSVSVTRPTPVCTDIVFPLLSSPPLVSDDSRTENNMCTNSGSISLRDGNVSNTVTVHDNNMSLTEMSAETSAVITEDTLHCVDVLDGSCPADSATPEFHDTEFLENSKQETVDTQEVSEKNTDLNSVSCVSDQDLKPVDESQQTDSDLAFLFDVPSQFVALSAPCKKAHKETAVVNGACSTGFLAAFTQFVKKDPVKKRSASCKVLKTNSASESAKEVPLKSGSGQRCVKQKPFTSQKRQRTFSEKRSSLDNRLLHRVARSQSIDIGYVTCKGETSLQVSGNSEEVDSSERLSSVSCTAVDVHDSTLCRDELLNIVSSHRQLVTLRHRVCELLETLLPDLRFPFGSQRDSTSVERFVKDITDILSNSEAHVEDSQKCSDPVVTLHHMPDGCLQSLQQQVIRLLSLLLPDTDLSDVSGDSLDVFLELMISANRPLPGTFHISESNLNLHPSHTYPQPFDKLELLGLPVPSLCHAGTDVKSEQADSSAARTESHVSAVDALFNMPSGLLPINTPGPVGDKRSIRRQVKDCLMFLDRDLT